MISSFRASTAARRPSFFSLLRGMASFSVHSGFAKGAAQASDSTQTVIIGQHRWLKQIAFAGELAAKLPDVTEALFNKAVKQLGEAGGKGQVPLHLNHAKVISIADKVSRHNSPSNVHAIFKELKGLAQPNGVKTLSVLLYCHYEHALASVAAAAKAFSLFSMKTAGVGAPDSGEKKQPTKLEQVHLEVVIAEGGHKQLAPADVAYLQALCDAIRDYARLVDTPANILHTEALLHEAEQMVGALGVPIEKTVIVGEELQKRGFGGIYSVGKAATHPPIFACFSHRPSGATENIALVGKGIVFDTGGMQIKGKTGMPSMKLDMGGAGAVLASFCALVKGGFKQNLHLLLCIAENSISPIANKPDDIITMLSGKTVEITNTDAEGRLVLGDGVFYARTKLNATTIIDMATLTGAQAYISGHIHGAVISNSESREKEALRAGLFSGDMLHPMVYAPDLHFSDLKSPVADMRNSNLGHMDGPPSSIAALFIHAQNDFTDEVDWIHVDFARPVLDKDERATGYGPALINALLAKHMDEAIGVVKASQQ